MKRQRNYFQSVLIGAALICGAANMASAENTLYGTYDLDGKATIKVSGNDMFWEALHDFKLL